MSELLSSTLGNTIIGIVFLALAAALTFLMFYVWKFPFDHESLKSAAPPRVIISHRLLGYLFVIIYIYIMWNMVPRLWSYQIELPARTVLHLALGILIGALLIIKLVIVRYFKHMEARLAPILGSGLFICTFLLVALVMPFSLREAYLEKTALGDASMIESRIGRVRDLLPGAGLKDEKLLAEISTKRGLITGRRILTAKCIQCHDLRTVLARPRTPRAWQQTVARMANRSTILNPITEDDQWYVIAYLVAVSPTLQETLKLQRKIEVSRAESQGNMKSAIKMSETDDYEYESAAAKKLFEQTCSQCHNHTQVEQAPPESKTAAIALVQRMVGNGLTASDKDLYTIIHYLTLTYVDESAQQQPVSETQSQGMALFSEKFCISCHGPAGKSPVSSSYPVLAGQNRDYLIQQFNDIKRGIRNNGGAETMSALVQNVSDREIAQIADYLAGQK
ncbi:MAG: c-type cytochrome [Proteobacteria bacterium]|nr:c-type cytochrome [Pseudomonadota bacterium]